jgi:cytochrome c553
MPFCARLTLQTGNLALADMHRYLLAVGFAVACTPVLAQSTSDEITFLSCQMCHGQTDSAGVMPVIQGKPYEGLVQSLASFSGQNPGTTIMHRFVGGLTPEERDSLARYISGLEGVSR